MFIWVQLIENQHFYQTRFSHIKHKKNRELHLSVSEALDSPDSK